MAATLMATELESVQGNIFYTIPIRWSFIRYKFFMGNSQRRVPKLKKQDKKLGEILKTLYMLSIDLITPQHNLTTYPYPSTSTQI